MEKGYKGKRCVYCLDRLALGPDHVFARDFFLASEQAWINEGSGIYPGWFGIFV